MSLVYAILAISLLALLGILIHKQLIKTKYELIKEVYSNRTIYVIYERRAIFFKVVYDVYYENLIAEEVLRILNNQIN